MIRKHKAYKIEINLYAELLYNNNFSCIRFTKDYLQNKQMLFNITFLIRLSLMNVNENGFILSSTINTIQSTHYILPKVNFSGSYTHSNHS